MLPFIIILLSSRCTNSNYANATNIAYIDMDTLKLHVVLPRLISKSMQQQFFLFMYVRLLVCVVVYNKVWTCVDDV